MAALSTADRALVWRHLMRRWSNVSDPCAFTKAELLAAVNAIDDWLEANAATINQALPAPFRSAATVEQKALLLSFVAIKRYGDDPNGGG